jgi:hypothetical protein
MVHIVALSRPWTPKTIGSKSIVALTGSGGSTNPPGQTDIAVFSEEETGKVRLKFDSDKKLIP